MPHTSWLLIVYNTLKSLIFSLVTILSYLISLLLDIVLMASICMDVWPDKN